MTSEEIVSLVFEYERAARHGMSAAREAAARSEIKAAIHQVVGERDDALAGLADYARDILKLEKSLEDMEKNL